jgi:hypothetical protein
MSSELERRLRILLAREVPPAATEGGGALESRLVGRLPAPRRGLLRRWLSAHRLAVAAVAVVLCVIGACRLPAEYAVDVGERVAILLDPSRRAAVDPAEIARHVEETWPIERLQVAVAVEQQNDGPPTTRVELAAVGDVTADEIWADLVETFPALAGARMEPEDLEVLVHGTLGGRLSHELLDLVIDEEGAEVARQQILDQLAASGLDGEADVSVTDHPDGRREVRVEVRAEQRE